MTKLLQELIMFVSFLSAVAVFSVVWLPCSYMLCRNVLVYRFRIGVLDDTTREWDEVHRRYDRLPTYDTMMWQLWRFDWSDYLDGTK